MDSHFFNFFQGGYSFYIRNKLKSGISNDKKVYRRKCFSVITKNLNWQILTKILVVIKRWDGVKDERMKTFNLMGVYLKIQF